MGRSSALAGGEFGDYAEFPPISLWARQSTTDGTLICHFLSI